MSYLFPESRIQIFCKAPIAGEVKTRLIPHLGANGAKALHERLAKRVIALCQHGRLAPLELWCMPDTAHDFFVSVADESTMVFDQRGSNLGERMLNGARHALHEGGAVSVVIIGTDCPNLDEDYLRRALDALQGHDAVIGPAEDGGYGLIGLRHADESLFSDIAWGSDTVCADTCRAFNAANLSWALLPLLWDVDRPEDVARLNDAKIDKASGAG